MAKLLKFRFGTLFGPAGQSAGITLIVVSIIMTFIDLSALLILPVGIVFAFTCNVCVIDPEDRKLKWAFSICRLLEFGKWEPITSKMYLSLIPRNKSMQYYSRSNRSVNISRGKCRIILTDAENDKIIPVSDFNTVNAGKKEIKNLADKLNLQIKSSK